MTFDERVYEVVKRIPRGYVTTYGNIARAIGMPRASRAVAGALHRNPTPIIIPCHRVVKKDGSLAEGFAFGGPLEQQAILEAENVPMTVSELSGKTVVVIEKCIFIP